MNSAPPASSATKPESETAIPSEDEQKRLKSLWAKTVSVLTFPTETVSIQAVYDEQECKTRKSLPLPDALKTGVWFSVTAFNPMGQKVVDVKLNVENDRKLESMLRTKLSPSPTSIVRFRGYDPASDWAEDGFSLQFVEPTNKDVKLQNETSKDDTKETFYRACEDAVRSIASEFDQAAIYRYRFDPATKRLFQTCVPCVASLRHVYSQLLADRIK